MPFKQVTEQDLKGKGVIGQPAVPGLSVTEMQKSVEQVVREAAIPAHNQLCEELEAEAAAADIGAAVPGSGDIPPETPKKLQSVLEAMLAWAKEKLGLKADKADTYTKQETEEKISEGISETGFEEAVQEAKQSAQEAKEYAESINPAQFAQAEEGVTTVNASKTQNTFDIELPNSNQFVIIPDAAYASGDTFKIAAQPVAAKLPNGDSLPDGFFEAGAKVLCLLKDNVLYFTGGGNAPGNVMRYRMDDGTPGQQPEQTIWGQTSDGQDAYVHSCTKAVYDSESEKTLDVLLREMLLAELPQPGQWNFAPYRISYGEGGVNAKRHPWVNFDDDLDKTVYAALYAAIGDTMSDGAADGMFNCKKLADRFPLVCGANFSVPVAGGEKEHTLTVEELPEHKHVMPYTTGSGASAGVGYKLGTSETQSWSATLTTGAGKAHNNMPPYIVQTVHVKS